jgi:hypothetical protein
MFFRYFERQSFTPIQNYRRNYCFFNVLFSTLLDSKQEDERLRTEYSLHLHIIFL